MQSATPSVNTEFVLIRVRSPLLTESQLISLPLGTEMFHFPRFAPEGDMTHAMPGCPIQKSPDQSFLAAPRGFSQPSTSFIASTSLGIHLWPLISFVILISMFTTLLNVIRQLKNLIVVVFIVFTIKLTLTIINKITLD
jgi:hypothetical protein